MRMTSSRRIRKAVKAFTSCPFDASAPKACLVWFVSVYFSSRGGVRGRAEGGQDLRMLLSRLLESSTFRLRHHQGVP